MLKYAIMVLVVSGTPGRITRCTQEIQNTLYMMGEVFFREGQTEAKLAFYDHPELPPAKYACQILPKDSK